MKTWLIWLCLLLPALARPGEFPLTMWKAERLASQGKWGDAANAYSQALKLKPKSAEATYNLAMCLYRQGQFEKSQELFKKAQELAPPGSLKGQAAYNEGNSLFQLKKTDEALNAYKTALRWNELDDDARYNIQVILDQKKPPKKDPPKPDPKKKPEDKKDKKDKKQPKNKKKPEQKPQKPDPKETPKPAPKDPQPSASPKPTQAERDKQEAERMLQFFQNREKQAQKKRMPVRSGPPTGMDDW